MNLKTAKDLLREYGFEVDDDELRAERVKIISAIEALKKHDFEVKTSTGRVPDSKDIEDAISARRTEAEQENEELRGDN